MLAQHLVSAGFRSKLRQQHNGCLIRSLYEPKRSTVRPHVFFIRPSLKDQTFIGGWNTTTPGMFGCERFARADGSLRPKIFVPAQTAFELAPSMDSQTS